MTFNIKTFVRENKGICIWVAFAGLLFLFRDMFGLVFITYILCFVTHSIIEAVPKKLNLNRRLLIGIIYLLFLVVIAALVFLVMPRLVGEARSFGEQIPASLQKLEAWALATENNYALSAFERIKEFLSPDQMLFRGWAMGRALLEKGLHYTSWFFLGLLFSFMIMLDLPKLLTGVHSLRFTRLAEVYEETAGSVVLFARVVGENFRAQIIIAAINTILTAIGLYLLGIKAVVLLSTIVFFCGLIPVLGVFISSVPIFLMAVNTGGMALGVWSMVMIVVIHAIEAYFLNPRIVSAVMSLNPVMTLIILYIAHSLIGIWGMLLGVPISVYIYRQIVLERKPDHSAGENLGPREETVPSAGTPAMRKEKGNADNT